MNHHIAKDWRGGGKVTAIASLLFTLFISPITLAANGDDGTGRSDYDLDDDGLIEINDLADLDEIRNNLGGAALYTGSTGCPATGCNGFELTTDLDFDTNQDGVMDANDNYWNEGEGWSPIGNSSNFFTGIFEGNGHVILNLYINRPSTEQVGLFSSIKSSVIRHLGLTGSLMSVAGYRYVGALVGWAYASNQISASYNTGSVSGSYGNVGGLVGLVGNNNQISASYNTGSVIGSSNVGGLVGYVENDNQISVSYNTGSVSGSSSVGGLVGWAYNSNQISASYNTGSVTGSSDHVGGLAGMAYNSNQISGSYNTGSVTGSSNVGGLMGQLRDSNQVSDSFSSGFVIGGASNIGGLIGYSFSSSNTINNSYWAIDSSGQSTSYRSSESNGYVGLTLATLQCATQANTDDNNRSCISAGGSDDLSPEFILFNGWKTSGYWDLGDNQQLPGLILNGAVHRDSDGDGSLDENDLFPFDSDNDGLQNAMDAFPLIAIGQLTDTDNDGRPDDCDQACIDTGMDADTDDDNDGVLDVNDEFSLISLNGRADFDGDGIPDNCDQACIDLEMTADTDIDNDGVLNINDAFDFNADESTDYDLDGIGDNADTDDDNDGVLDEDDLDLGADNGQPMLAAIAADLSLSVTTENGYNALLTMDSDFMQAFEATDRVDNNPRLEATLNGSVLTLDENDQVLLPAGNLNIVWVAIDDAGNISNSLIQNVKVYPRVRFTLAESMIGEASDAVIKVELSGESPVYPVTVELEIDALSEIDQNDLSDSFDISAKHYVMIEQGDGENASNTLGSLVIPVIDDGVSENDEQLVINLNGVTIEVSDENEENLFSADENFDQHTLTVTDLNLAPVVQLLLQQDGVEVANIKQDGGDVTVTALITDGNGNDTHTLVWDLNSLGLNAPLGNVLTFSPTNLAIGEYSLSVEVTDDGINPLSAAAALDMRVAEPRLIDPVITTPASSSSGGGTLWWMLLLLAGASVQRRRSYLLK